MKNIFLFLIIAFSMHSFAEGGDMGGGSSTALGVMRGKLFTIPHNKIEALISNDGVYARVEDLQEGFEFFSGLSISNREIQLNLSKDKKLNVESILLKNGSELRIEVIRAKSGGDMGGG